MFLFIAPVPRTPQVNQSQGKEGKEEVSLTIQPLLCVGADDLLLQRSTGGGVLEHKSLSLIHCIARRSHGPLLPPEQNSDCGTEVSLRDAFLASTGVLGCQLCSFYRIWHHACHYCPPTANSNIHLGDGKPKPLKSRQIFVFVKVCN